MDKGQRPGQNKGQTPGQNKGQKKDDCQEFTWGRGSVPLVSAQESGVGCPQDFSPS